MSPELFGYLFLGYCVSVLVLWGYFGREIADEGPGGYFLVSMAWPLALIVMFGSLIRCKKDARDRNRGVRFKEAEQKNARLEEQIHALENELTLHN